MAGKKRGWHCPCGLWFHTANQYVLHRRSCRHGPLQRWERLDPYPKQARTALIDAYSKAYRLANADGEPPKIVYLEGYYYLHGPGNPTALSHEALDDMRIRLIKGTLMRSRSTGARPSRSIVTDLIIS